MYAPTGTVTRLDTLTTLALARHHTGDYAEASLVNDPDVCLALATSTVAGHGGMGRSYRHAAVRQHLFGALFTYGRFFAPRHSWSLIDADPDQALLHWRHPDALVPDVVDTLAATGFGAVVAPAAAQSAVWRVCNLLDRTASTLTFPGEPATFVWAPVDDPIHSREMAVLA